MESRLSGSGFGQTMMFEEMDCRLAVASCRAKGKRERGAKASN